MPSLELETTHKCGPYKPCERYNWNLKKPFIDFISATNAIRDVAHLGFLTAAQHRWIEARGKGRSAVHLATCAVVGRLPRASLLLTNRHVAEGSNETAQLRVLANGIVTDYELLIVHLASDLALIAVSHPFDAQLDVYNGEVAIGERLYGVGFPKGTASLIVCERLETDLSQPHPQDKSALTVLSHQLTEGASGSALMSWQGELAGLCFGSCSSEPGKICCGRSFLVAAKAIIKFYARVMDFWKEIAASLPDVASNLSGEFRLGEYVFDVFTGRDATHVIDEEQLRQGKIRCQQVAEIKFSAANTAANHERGKKEAREDRVIRRAKKKQEQEMYDAREIFTTILYTNCSERDLRALKRAGKYDDEEVAVA
ncbi:hypothetical protein EJ08DRAFT_703018 [Tothia fuscella]|uniref:Serine protease n=1 Tax=Tothia fuscella TaxID=1048955 RepID=A0A9P4NFH8_9PEZI|nr:hypothetical protein EJ08DRAFT_703018 [Tothia fuscella]